MGSQAGSRRRFGWPDCCARSGRRQFSRPGQGYSCGWKGRFPSRSSPLPAESPNASGLPAGRDRGFSGQPSRPDLQGTAEPSATVALPRSPRRCALKIFGKTLQCLLVAPGGPDTVDSAVALVVMPSLAKGDLPGNGMLGLGFCRSKPRHAFSFPSVVPSAHLSFSSASFFK